MSVGAATARNPVIGSGRRAMRRGLAAVVLLALAACGSAGPVPEDRYYRLDVAAPEALAEPALNGIVEIERLTADGVTAGRPIVYAERPNSLELKSYHYHFWTEPPTAMLRDALVTAMRASGAAREVVTPQARVSPDYIITGEIKRMERVVGGSVDKAVLEIELVLRGARSSNLRLLRTYRVEREVAGGGLSGFVEAMNGAAAEIFLRFVADLAAL